MHSLHLLRLLSLLVFFFPGFLFLGGCVSQAPQIYTGELSGDLYWNGTIRLRGDVIVPADSTLHVAPGSRIEFFPPGKGEGSLTEHPYFAGSELIVRGRIKAVGTPDAPIEFCSFDPEGKAGSWGGINLQQSPQAVFEYCRFIQADSAVHSQNSTVFVEHCLFEENLVAIRFHSSQMLIENNLIQNNGTGIRFHFGSPVICNNEISGNEKSFFITSFPRDYHIENNNIVSSQRYSVVLGEEVPDNVLMPRNFWGTSQAVDIEAGFFDGLRFDYLGEVIYLPYLTHPNDKAGLLWRR